MLAKTLSLALLASAGVIEARSLFDPSQLHRDIHRRQNNNNNNNNNNDDVTATVLAANAIQSASFLEGEPKDGQAKSKTSQNNFINNCAGKTLTNGLQVQGGSCNGIPMGDIPAKANMVSSIITFPLYGSATIESDTTFDISVQMANLVAGSFTNAASTYYAAPQQLSGGKVVGHTHVTVQDLGKSLNPQQPLDATQFAFFKGINDAGDGNGLLKASVTGGLPAGNYRVCTMASSSNHQPVLMPVAQRGTPDDCSKFTVVEKGNTGNGASTGGNGNGASTGGNGNGASTGGNGNGASTGGNGNGTSNAGGNGASSSAAASTTTKAGGKGGKGAKGAADNKATKAATTTKAANGGQGKAVSSLKLGPFLNTTFAVASPTARGGNGGKAVIGATTTTAQAVSSTAAAAASPATPQKGGKKVSTGRVVHKVTVVQTFFQFVRSLGGLPPSVGKQGNRFACLNELFDDLNSAAAAACGHQYTRCVSFSGPGFSFEECRSQRQFCGAAASSAKPSAAPVTVTATVTVPVSVTITGSVIAESTVSVTVTADASANTDAAAVATSAAAKTTAAAVVVGDVAGSEDSADCSVVTGTVTVDAPEETGAAASPSSANAAPIVSASSVKAPFSNSTATATIAAPATASKQAQVSNSAALGGIAALAVTDSGDAKRPFAVNGNTFASKSAAAQRACDIQFNACANAVNGGKLPDVKMGDCQSQKDSCGAAAATA
ncbi:uncharacterized protein BP5553_04437 [Venustampulla echinocandica]|uniref:Ribosomal protein s17 n=1 Tax=Venustampulla echinocandica TaxID=2656787 RepID=A0A370TNA9_9HELO|nr:uncharacterized protein BP5553_04437 [Venustampulla echinocandica]RDL37004.1 hypothetical protein BP5553_04437 [Venustampulla echinocandica]